MVPLLSLSAVFLEYLRFRGKYCQLLALEVHGGDRSLGTCRAVINEHDTSTCTALM